MRWLPIIVLATVAFPLSSQAAVSLKDDLCGHLKRFEDTSFSKGSDGKPVRRFAEFQWSADWLTGGTWGCRHSKDAAARAFCAYLIGHTNQEFSAVLPIRVLRCHGYVFPSYSTDWRDWTADILLRGAREDRSTDLDVYLIRGSVDRAVRISVVPNDPSGEDEEPPPLKDTPSVADKDAQ